MSSTVTMRTWPELIESLEKVPAFFKKSFESVMYNNELLFPYTVFVPPSRIGFKKNNAKLVSISGNSIYVMEKVKRELVFLRFKLSDINYIESGSVLLNSWIRISGVVDGSLITKTVEYNTIGQDLFDPFVKRIRSFPAVHESGDSRVEFSKFAYLEKLNYKFMNYARKSIPAGEKVIGTLYQPEIKVKLFTIFNRTFYRTVSVPHLSILTERELVIIRDSDTKKEGLSFNYGGIWNYIPIDKISNIATVQNQQGYLLLTITLPKDDMVTFIFDPSEKENVNCLITDVLRTKEKQGIICN